MATFLRDGTDRPGAARARRTPARFRVPAALAGLALLGLLTGCGGDDGSSGTPTKASGTAGTASGTPTSAAGSSGPTSPGGDATPTGAGRTSSSAPSPVGSGTPGGRCHTSELRASVGDNDPGAGQENFRVVLTNGSSRTCTVRGFPGAAFVDASGRQLGPDPKRSSEKPRTVTLAPGQSALAGLTFSNPGISGAKTAEPDALLVTPPDEKASLRVRWTHGEVPVSGNASTVSLTPLRTGP
ncbi:DUF4232 domain-containing protein [Streptomyces sp. NPDC005496]|uniref:DUF4232 domain-containing protein n=1 Tax=Streptomyces sp. NPDC005496 TaxID=3364716 RepID=UPI00369F1D41